MTTRARNRHTQMTDQLGDNKKETDEILLQNFRKIRQEVEDLVDTVLVRAGKRAEK